MLTSLELQPDSPPPDRCGTCTRCIDACPTSALVPGPGESWSLDARHCISYLTIEKRGPFDPEEARSIGNHIFGCDICQDVCPWNRRAAITLDERFQPAATSRDLSSLLKMTQEQFREQFRRSPLKRAKHHGFLRNVAAAAATALSLAFRLQAAPQDPLNNPGFVHFYNLEYEAALMYFEQQVKVHPTDLNQYNHVAQTILYRQIYREGELTTALVSSSNFFLTQPKLHFPDGARAQFNHAIDHVLHCAPDAQDSATLYATAVAHGLRANYLFLGEKDYIGALREATAARKTSERVLALDPGFSDAHLIPGLYKYVVGSLPFYMRWFSFLGGFQGDVNGGIRDLEVVRHQGLQNRYDAEVLLAAIYRREHQYDKAISLLQTAAARFPRNPVLRSELDSVSREKMRRVDARRIHPPKRHDSG